MAKANEEVKKMFLYVGAYKDEESASEDYDALHELHKAGLVGNYDVGIVSKNEAGKLAIKRHTNSTAKGAWSGLGVGVLLGIIFPPSILASGAIGAGAGAAISHRFNELSKDDLKIIGDYIQNDQSALVVVGESNLEAMVDKATTSALKEYKKEFNANAKDLTEALDQAIKS